MTMKSFKVFLSGFIVAAVIFGGGWLLDHEFGFPMVTPDQIAFESDAWRRGSSLERGHMYRSVVAFLEKERPSREVAEEFLGPSGGLQMAYRNGADSYLVYQIDLGQKISGIPYLNKLGVAFHIDGTYSHIAVWD